MLFFVEKVLADFKRLKIAQVALSSLNSPPVAPGLQGASISLDVIVISWVVLEAAQLEDLSS